jgi:subtilisin-like proprotein convertase family protein
VASTGCATTSTIESTPLIVEAGGNLTLPIGTPFKLEGNVEGIDSNTVTYCWEQVNENNARTVFPNPDLTDSNAILFRSFPPTANNARFFPNFKDLLIGLNAGQWEKIPNVSRTADFRLTVRDNRFETNNVNYDDVQVNFDSNYGPFKITTLNANNIFLVAGETQIIQWDVNNTNLLPGASTVNIQLSTDGGTTFETIASNVPNNGSYLLEIPDITASNCRLMIAPTNANFFTVNGAPFTIGLETDNNCVTYNSSENLNLEILDSFDAIQSSTISITATGVISDINVGVNIVHDFIGDLGIVLTSPSGTQVVLKSPRSCGDDTDLIATFDDEAIAFNCSESGENLRQGTPNNTLLSAFNGEIVTGDWTIEVGDFSGGDQGLFKSWFIELCNPTQREFSIDDTVFGAFTVSPNPSLNSGIFKIRANALHLPTTFRIEVYNTRGQIVYDESFAETSFFNEIISIANVGTGLYFLNLTDGNGNRFTRKLLIR